jgi:hypothetical protein
MQESLAISRRSAIAAERALIDVQRALMVGQSVQVYPGVRNEMVIAFRMEVLFTNAGNTVAKNFIGNTTVAVFDGQMPDSFNYPDRGAVQPLRGVCGPRVTMVFPAEIAIQDIVDIQQGRKEGFVYGWVEYNDIFEATRRRRTEYCAKIRVVGDPHTSRPIGNPSPLSFEVYGPYNGTDEDCFHQPGQMPIGGLPPITQPPPPPAQQPV